MGGTANLRLRYTTDTKNAEVWEGYKNRITCYYTTSYNLGSDFIDSPKTYGIAVYCPLSLDEEIGAYSERKRISPGKVCRPLSDFVVNVELSFTASKQKGPSKIDSSDPVNTKLIASFATNPASSRAVRVKESQRSNRPHAVCAVQTFRNPQTGPMLYMFAAYWIRVGWKVIIYDRFGQHREFLESLLHHAGLDYHPYTVFQLAMPNIYSNEYLTQQSIDDKYFYKKEKVFAAYLGSQADTANQDHDKSRTYDYARIEYSHLDSILFVDADEMLYCPLPAGQSSPRMQKRHQQRIMTEFSAKGIDEMRFVRLPYAGKADRINLAADVANTTRQCMLDAFKTKHLGRMFSCWSSATSFDHYAKSADLGRRTP